MPKFKDGTDLGLTREEWRELPETFGAPTCARIMGKGQRFITNHGCELGGVKIGGSWIFSKSVLANMLHVSIEV